MLFVSRSPLLVFSSATLLVLSFPSFNQPWAAWIALVPWLRALRRATPRQAFARSYLVGLLFFLASMGWLIHLTAFGGPAAILGWLVLCAYLALYFGAFGVLVTAISTQHTAHSKKHMSLTGHWSLVTGHLLLIPAAWVALEFLRSRVLSGFGWNLLGYSQASWLPIIQIAEAAGVWGVSWLIVMVNVVLAEMLHNATSDKLQATSRDRRLGMPIIPLTIAGCAVSLIVGYGTWRLSRHPEGRTVRVAVVQGNIPQERKWDETSQEWILQRYERLTHEAATAQPDLIVWPETAVPGLIGWDRAVTRRVQQLAQAVQIPLLVGAPSVAPAQVSSQDVRLFNSALLVDRQGVVAGRYDKVHLVPFGEFIPGESFAPWLRAVLPPIGDFVPGRDATVFLLEGQGKSAIPSPLAPRPSPPFGALICFEDIFPQLARRLVQGGAQMLVVITNDAWFGNTAAAYQHAQASIFRAVELRVPVVRAANTGWSGCITETGRRIASVHDAHGEELFVEGVAVCEMSIPDAPTPYDRWGDWVAWLCLGACLGGAVFAIINGWRVNPAQRGKRANS